MDRKLVHFGDLFNEFRHSYKGPIESRKAAFLEYLKTNNPGLRNRFPSVFNKPSTSYIELEDLGPEVVEYADPLVETSFIEGALGEATPLLGGTTVAVGTGLSTSSTVGLGILGAGAVYGVNKALSSADSDHTKPIVSVSADHNYLGPGNTVGSANDPLPVDDADRIAYNHDLNYNKADTEQDIRNADNAAVAEFGEKALEGDWRSAVGAVGIQTKQLFEQAVGGVVYPRLGKQLCLLLVVK